jgi:hypothetical protein
VDRADAVDADRAIRLSPPECNDINEGGAIAPNASELCSGQVAERRAFAGDEDGGQELTFARKVGVADRVDAAREAMQGPACHALRYRAVRKP